jgi:hypothetical protein
MFKTLTSLTLFLFPAVVGAQGIATSADAGAFQAVEFEEEED